MARANIRYRMYVAKYKKTIPKGDGTYKELWCELGKAFRDEGPTALSNIKVYLHSTPTDPNWSGELVLFPIEEK